jgi:hypothetical protein
MNLCKVCTHSQRLAIDKEIVRGGNLANIAKEFNLSYPSLYRHSKEHISRQLATAMVKKGIDNDFDLISKIEIMFQRVENIFLKSEKAGKNGLALKAINSQKGIVELLTKISDSIQQAKQTQIEYMKLQNGEYNEEQNTENAAKLSILTIPELELFEKLCLKLNSQDENIIVISETQPILSPSIRFKRKDKTLSQSRENNVTTCTKIGHNEIIETGIVTDHRIKEVEPEQIPLTPWSENSDNPRYHLKKERLRQIEMDNNDSYREMREFKASLNKKTT